MEWLLLIIFLALVSWYRTSAKELAGTIEDFETTQDSIADLKNDLHQAALEVDRTQLLKEAISYAANETIDLDQEWRFKRATKKQLNFLNSLLEQHGSDTISDAAKSFTKGQLADAIGTFLPPDEQDLDKAKALEINYDGMHETAVRHAIAGELRKPGVLEKFQQRPPNARQSFQIKFLTGKLPQNLTYDEAKRRVPLLMEEQPERADELLSIELTWDEFQKEEILDVYCVKKPTWSQFEEAVFSLVGDEEAGEDVSPSDEADIADKLIELYPALLGV
jgi:hypothetical protein